MLILLSGLLGVFDHPLDLGDGAAIEEPVFEDVRSGAGDQSCIAANHVQEPEASGFAGLRLRRADIEVGDLAEAVEAPGMGDPEDEGGELVIIADEELAEERGECVEGLERGKDCGVLLIHGGDLLVRFVFAIHYAIVLIACQATKYSGISRRYSS
jgi:hypothetical protein